MPYLPAGGAFGLIPLPVGTLAGLSLITVAYALASEVFKQRFLHSNSDTRPPSGRTWHGQQKGRRNPIFRPFVTPQTLAYRVERPAQTALSYSRTLNNAALALAYP